MSIKTEAARPAELDRYIDLFSRSFSSAKLRSRDYLHWLYLANPAGSLFGIDATQAGRLIAHTGCIPVEIFLKGTNCRALLALNIATDPNFQGKGLFSSLGRELCERAGAEGYSCIIGVSNAKALPGWTKRLGFQDVCGLAARLGVGLFPSGDQRKVQAHSDFHLVWRSDTLEWRMRSPVNPLALLRKADGAHIIGRTGVPGLTIQTPLFQDLPSLPVTGNRPPVLSFASLSIGLQPAGSAASGLSFPLPDGLKPSPLRLIYRNLVDSGDRLDAGSILFRFIDFDAY